MVGAPGCPSRAQPSSSEGGSPKHGAWRSAGRARVAACRAVRALYVDLDGTLLGRGGSLFDDGEGGVSLLGARAVEACLRGDVEVVPVSGRRGTNVREDARLLGATSYVFEAGACVVLDGEEHWLTAPWLPRDDASVHAQLAATGAPDLLLEAYAGRLEHHAPWHVDREVS